MLKHSLCLIAWTVLLVAAGCVPQQPGGLLTPEQQKTRALLEKADTAWQNERYQQAEELYRSLLEASGLTRQERILIRKRAAASAVENGHFQRAEDWLENWRNLEPAADRTWEWQALWLETLQGRGQTERLLHYAQELIVRKDRAFGLKLKTASFLCPVLFEAHRFRDLLTIQQTFYEQIGENNQRSRIIQSLNACLHNQDLQALTDALQQCREKPHTAFPCLLLHWHAVKKRFEQGELGRFQARQRFNSLFQEADPALQAAFSRDLQALDLEPLASGPGLHIAILVPLTGAYAEIGWDILTGADVAQWQQVQNGTELRVSIINTAQAAWKEELSSLPEDCFLVGGPLREAVWEKIHAGGLHTQRNFFAFRSHLGPGREGLDGYRFFPSRSDQVRGLLQFLTRQMGVYQYGILYPKSDYGRKMSQVFFQEVQACGGEITALQGYSSSAQSDYRSLLAEFLRVPQAQARADAEQDCSAAFRPTPDFRAVFLPDGFSAARRIIPEFFFFDEYRLMFLGPTLWSQQIQSVSGLDPSYYKLALIPGAWWSENPSPAARRLEQGLSVSAQGEPNFWIALGYDLVRFFSRLSADLSQTQGTLQSALDTFSDFSWSMAPLEWDATGKAHQDMHVFQLVKHTLQPVTQARLQQRIESMQQEYEYVLLNRLEESGCFPEEAAQPLDNGTETAPPPPELQAPKP
jgi:hypothetical protein